MNNNPEENFQTPPIVCNHMVSMMPNNPGTVLEPTPGKGNLVESLRRLDCASITAPKNFYDLPADSKFDFIAMNPPFTPMKEGYKILEICMGMSDNIIALMPWLVLINGEKRTKMITDFGLVSITHLPRKTFHSRVQTCILELRRGYKDKATFTTFNW